MENTAIKVVQYEDAEAFYARVEAYLLPSEATHNLLFGLLSNIQHDPARFPEAILALVEDEGEVQFVALRTDAEHDLILSLAKSPEAVMALALEFQRTGLVVQSVSGPKDESKTFADAWAHLSQQRYWAIRGMRAFRLEKVIPALGVVGRLRRATVEDRDQLIEWDMAFRLEAFPDDRHVLDDVIRFIDLVLRFDQRGVYVWEDADGGAVSYACYSGPTPHGIRIGPVYTPSELRGHGYASACVAGMSQFLLCSGYQFCFLFTNLANPTANHIYQVIGYEAVADFTVYDFSAD